MRNAESNVEWLQPSNPSCSPKPNRLLYNFPTHQLAVIQVTDWSTRGLVNSPTAILFKSWQDYTIF